MGMSATGSSLDVLPPKAAAAKTLDPNSPKRTKQPTPSRNQNGDLDLSKEVTVERPRSRPHCEHDKGCVRPIDRAKGKKIKPSLLK